MTATTVAPNLDLRLERTGDGSIQGRYRFSNGSGEVLCVLDQVYSTDSSGLLHLDPGLAYVFFEDGILTVARQLVRIPPDSTRTVYAPEVPCLRRVLPGERLEGAFVLPAAPRRYDPYTLDGDAISPERIREVILSIGYYIDSPEVQVYQAKMADGTVLDIPAYSHIAARQCLVRSEPAAWPK